MKYYVTAIIVAVLLFSTGLFLFIKKDTAQRTLSIAPNFSFTKPKDWYIDEKPVAHQYILRYDDKNVDCAIEVFIVKPSVAKTFRDWLGTSLFNTIFLDNAQESTPSGIPIISGQYKFPNNNINKEAIHNRILLNIDGTFVDFSLGYDAKLNESQAAPCIAGYEELKSSLKY